MLVLFVSKKTPHSEGGFWRLITLCA